MRGASHAATGAAAGFAATATYSVLVHDGMAAQPGGLPLLAAGTLIGTGFALVPDVDHPKSLATHAQGPLTRALGWGVRAASRGVVALTATRYDTGDGAHRHLTHTFLFAVVLGLALGAGSAVWEPVLAVVLWLATSLALRGFTAAFAPNVRMRAFTTWVGVSVVAAAVTWVLTSWEIVTGAYVGACVTVGVVVHILGDALTKEAAPMWWPVRIHGKRWYNSGLPPALRFSTGAWPETVIAWVCWSVPAVGVVVAL